MIRNSGYINGFQLESSDNRGSSSGRPLSLFQYRPHGVPVLSKMIKLQNPSFIGSEEGMQPTICCYAAMRNEQQPHYLKSYESFPQKRSVLDLKLFILCKIPAEELKATVLRACGMHSHRYWVALTGHISS